VIESSYAGVDSRVTYFVPVSGDLEIWQLKLTNASDKARQLSIFPYSEFTLWCEPESRNIQWSLHLTRGDYRDGFVTYDFIEPHPAFDMKANAHYMGDRPGMAFMTLVGSDILGFECVRDKFLGFIARRAILWVWRGASLQAPFSGAATAVPH
jgi:N,N'-diacetylchitobiose phosphorylase